MAAGGNYHPILNLILLVGILCLLFGVSGAAHNLNPDYTIQITSDTTPVEMRIPAGETVTVKTFILVHDGHYATDGIRFRIESSGINIDELLFDAHTDTFPMQIGTMPSGPSHKFQIAVPDDLSLVGNTVAGRITGEMQYPEWVESDIYRVASMTVDIPVQITVLEAGARGNGDEHPVISLSASYTLAAIGLILLMFSARMRRTARTAANV